MLARLWWKDARQFWPIWAALIVFAAVAQCLALTYGDVGGGLLTPLALGWAALYAFAVSAAAFAGERESNTLLLLDVLPVSRSMLWRGKTSFALLSTLALAIVLALLASLGTTERNSAVYGYGLILFGFGTLLFEAIAWGLFWSAVSGNALVAAVLAIVSVGGASAILNLPWLDLQWAEAISRRVGFNAASSSSPFDVYNPFELMGTAPQRLALALLALAFSRGVMTRRPRPNRALRQPIEAPAERARPRAAPFSVAGRLAWQAVRECWRVGLVLGPVTVGALILLGNGVQTSRREVGPLAFTGELAALAMGVSVFAADNRARTARFYLHHGVRPTAVWAVKQLVWVLTLLLILSAQAIAATVMNYRLLGTDGAVAIVTLVYAYAVAQLGGLLIRRGITAWTVSFLGLFLIGVPAFGLWQMQIVPVWALALPPLILLATSWAWCGAWMADRPGPARWVRLALLLVLPWIVLASAFIIYRAESVPDIGPLYTSADLRQPPIAPRDDAAEIYRRISDEMNALPEADPHVSHSGTRVEVPEADWRRHKPFVDRIRAAAAMPLAGFSQVENMTYQTTGESVVQKMRSFAVLLMIDARERRFEGDLAGAWEDIMAIFRMARQLGKSPATAIRLLTALNVDHLGLQAAMLWAEDSRQTPERVQAALKDVLGLAPIASPSATLKVESAILEKTLRLPDEDLQSLLFGIGREKKSPLNALAVLAVATPWERQRAVRVVRLLTADTLQYANEEPSRWPVLIYETYLPVTSLSWPPDRPVHRISAEDLTAESMSTPLVRLLSPTLHAPLNAYWRNVVYRRALVQMLAIRSWQLRHGGRLPESLSELVPSELEQLPTDPYSGQPFHYVPARGQRVVPPSYPLDSFQSGLTSPESETYIGQMLLYSVGPDGKDNGAQTNSELRSGEGDYIFPLPDPDAARKKRPSEMPPEPAIEMIPGPFDQLPPEFAPPSPDNLSPTGSVSPRA